METELHATKRREKKSFNKEIKKYLETTQPYKIYATQQKQFLESSS